jgi:hypothetical protein
LRWGFVSNREAMTSLTGLPSALSPSRAVWRSFFNGQQSFVYCIAQFGSLENLSHGEAAIRTPDRGQKHPNLVSVVAQIKGAGSAPKTQSGVLRVRPETS